MRISYSVKSKQVGFRQSVSGTPQRRRSHDSAAVTKVSKSKDTNITGTNNRFQELLQELADVHVSELEKQKVTYEERLLASQNDTGSKRGSLPTSWRVLPDGDDVTSIPPNTFGPEPLKKVEPPVGVPGSLTDFDVSEVENSDEQLLFSVVPLAKQDNGGDKGYSGVTRTAFGEIPEEHEPTANGVSGVARAVSGEASEEYGPTSNGDSRITRAMFADRTEDEEYTVNGRATRNTRIQTCARVTTVGENKWKHLVQRATEAASRGIHLPRKVWKEGLHSKMSSQEKLAKESLQHLSDALNVKKRETTNRRRKTHLREALGAATGVAQIFPQARKYSFTALVKTIKSNWNMEALDPHSGPRFAWSMMAMALMLYDLLYIPMQAFNLPESVAFRVMDLLAQVYWTIDIPMTFFTAVYVRSLLEKRFSQIAWMYIRSWFVFDVLVTLPQWFPLLAGDDDSFLSNLDIFRFARALRFLRLVRLAKFMHVLRDALEVVNSPYVLLVIGIMKTMVLLLLFNHVVACVWFFIGIRNTSGWVEHFGIRDTSIGYQYLCSLHWTLTQFQGTSEIMPRTILERAYAVSFLLMALFLLAWFVSSLTTNMGQLKDLHNGKHAQQRAVKNYLSENGISKQLSVAVNRYIEWNRRHRNRQHDAEVLLVLPTKLLMDIYDEVRGPLLAGHPFFLTFRENYLRVHRRLCYESLEQLSPAPSELVFAEGDECFHMYFVMCGQLRYEPHLTTIGRVKKGGCDRWEEEFDAEDAKAFDQTLSDDPKYMPIRLNAKDWISEAVLWTEWEHCGHLTGLDDCALMLLHSNRFSSIVKSFVSARSVASLYARNFIVGLNRFGTVFTDVINHADLFAPYAYDEARPTQAFSFHTVA